MITAFLKAVPDVIKLPVAALLGALLIFYPATWYGASQEKTRNEIAQLEKSIEVIRLRAATDADIATRTPSDLCRSFGLSEPNYRECVRRSTEANAVTGNGVDNQLAGPSVCKPGGVEQRIRGEAGVLETLTPAPPFGIGLY